MLRAQAECLVPVIECHIILFLFGLIGSSCSIGIGTVREKLYNQVQLILSIGFTSHLLIDMRQSHIGLKMAGADGEKILIVDDFLAHGSALNGLIAIAEEAGCEVVGCCAVIEKGDLMGGDNLRARGYRVESLAIIEEINDEGIVFRGEKPKVSDIL